MSDGANLGFTLKQCCICFVLVCYCCGIIAVILAVVASSSLSCFVDQDLDATNAQIPAAGESTAISCAGERVVVGIPAYDAGKGVVEMYTLIEETLLYESFTTLTPPEPAIVGSFGRVVGISCDASVVVVGEPGFADETDGRFLVYVLNPMGELDLSQMFPNPDLGNSAFGTAVEISCDGSTIVAGNGPNRRVYVYILNSDTSLYALHQSLFAPAKDSFGSAVALGCNGETLAVGVPALAETHVYQRNSSGLHAFSALLQSSDTDSLFGSALSVAGRGSAIAVGIPRHNSAGGSIVAAGAVGVFERQSNGSYALRSSLVEHSVAQGMFGTSVRIDFNGNRLLVGAWDTAEHTGHVFFYKFSSGTYAFDPSALSNVSHPTELGLSVSLGFAGKQFSSTSNGPDRINSTRVGVIGCDDRAGTLCPQC